MKINYYVSIGVSIIMLMMGILFLIYPFPETTYLGENEFIRFMFGGMLIVYGAFRAYSAYSKLKMKDRKLHYYDSSEDDDRTI